MASIPLLAPRIRADGYVGLYNQGATCYLNSLLQSLFFTPEFRSALLHRWQYNAVSHPKADKCIPYQLQLLFARLLASKRPAVETAALTRSFRWTDAESFRQHDIQELMRVLFAALDKTLNKSASAATAPAAATTEQTDGQLNGKHVNEMKTDAVNAACATPSASPSASPQLSPTPSSPLSPTNLSSSFPSFSPTSPSFVHQLYCGKLTDYLRCLSCHTARQRTDDFMDVSLDVEHCTSLEQAMGKFIEPETLTGDNRWRCDSCQTKVDAQKGLHFHTLPPVLTIQLKRFVFDFNLMQRTKLQHRVTFSDMIDMAAYLPAAAAQSSPLIYDLFAVLMHSGTANGGHYYSYIRAFHGQFLEFNDTNVYALPTNAWEQAYGGGRGACAYMLIYRSRELEMEAGGAVGGGLGLGSEERLVSLEELEREGAGGQQNEWRLMKERGGREEDAEAAARHQRQREVDLVPAALKAVIDAEDEVWLKQQQQQEAERRRMEVTVLYAGEEHTFHFDQETAMADCLTAAAAHFALPASLSSDDLRFRRYDRTHEWTAEPYPAHLTLSQCHFNKRNTVTLEIKQPDTDWSPHNPHLIPVRLVRAHADNLAAIVQQSAAPSSDDCRMLSFDCSLPLCTFRVAAAALFGLEAAQVRLVRLLEDRGEVLDVEETSLREYRVSVGDVLYVEEVDSNGAVGESGGVSSSPLLRLLDDSKCQIKILFNLPTPLTPSSSAAPAVSSAAVDLADAPAYEQAIYISKHATLRSLKSAISPLVALPSSAFRLSRNECSAHWKDEDATLSQLGLVDYSSVYVSEGRQCGKDEYNLRCYLLQPNQSQHRSSTWPASSFLFLFDLPTPTSSTIAQLKVQLLSHLNAQFGDMHGGGNGLGVVHFRLRDKKGAVSSRLYEEGRVVGEVLVDEGEVVVEPCESEEAARVLKECVLVRWCWWDGRQLSGEHELMVRKMVIVGTIREEMRAAWRRGRGGGGSSKRPEVEKRASRVEEEKQPADSTTAYPPLWLARGMARVRMRKVDVDKVSWLSEAELPDNKLAKNNPLRLSAGDLIIATTVPPTPAFKAGSQPTAAAVPEAPSLSAPPAPPLAPPLPPAAGPPGAAAVPSATDVTRPSLSALSSAKSRLRRAAGVKGGSEVTIKTGRVVPVREYGLFIDIEDEIAAIDRACAEAERLERVKQADQAEEGTDAHAAEEEQKPVEEHKE